MESLQADILKARTDAENLASDIAQLNKDIDGELFWFSFFFLRYVSRS